LRDRTALLVSVVAPLGLAFIFSQLLAGTTDFRAVYVVADMDGGPLATLFRDDVLGSLEGGESFEITDLPTEAAARAAVADGTADAAFLVPAGFSAAIGAGQAVTLEVVGARDSGLATEIARSVAQVFGDGVVTVQLAVATATELGGAGGPGTPGASPDAGLQARIASAASSARPPVILTDQTAALRQLSLASYFSASMAILFLFFSAQMGMISLFDERRQGTLGRMLAGPVKPWTVLGGKLLGGFVQGMLAMTVLVVATTLLIGASWGSPLGVALVCTAGVIAALGISTLVISFTNSAEVAGAASSAVAITLGVLGGTFSPTAQAPEVMGTLALFTPHGWFMRGLGDMQGGGTVADSLPAVGVLLAMGLVTGGIGMLRSRRLVKAR
jgi:ABC-2 type transport system permease protein